MYHPVVLEQLVAQHTAQLRSRGARRRPTREGPRTGAVTRARGRWRPATWSGAVDLPAGTR
jgi:hypothetical protein